MPSSCWSRFKPDNGLGRGGARQLGEGAHRGRTKSAAAVSLCLGVLFGLGAETVVAAEQSQAEWVFRTNPYVWALGIEGNDSVRGINADVDASFLDIVDSSGSLFPYNGCFDATKGDWSVQLVPTVTRLGAGSDDLAAGGLDLEANTTIAIVELTGLYRIGN